MLVKNAFLSQSEVSVCFGIGSSSMPALRCANLLGGLVLVACLGLACHTSNTQPSSQHSDPVATRSDGDRVRGDETPVEVLPECQASCELGCGPGELCHVGTCQADIACANLGDCPNGSICVTDLGVCAAACGPTACREGETCLAGACYAACADDSACAGDQAGCATAPAIESRL